MFCPKCGKELADAPKYCRYCGVKIEQECTKEGSIINRKMLIPGMSLLVLLAIMMGGLYLWNHSAYRIYRNLLNGNEQKANRLFETYYDDLADHNGKLERMVLNGVDENWQDFLNEKISAEEANDYLNKIEALGAVELEELIGDKRNGIEKLKKSRQKYAEGIESLEKGDYEAAILSFGEVIEDDSYYEEARQQEVIAKSSLKDQVSSAVEQERKSHAYEEALAEIANAERVLPDDSDLNEWKAVCEREAFLYEIVCAFQNEDFQAVLELLQSDVMTDVVNEIEDDSDIFWITEADNSKAAKGLGIYPGDGGIGLYYGEYIDKMRQGEGIWLLSANDLEKNPYDLYQGMWADDYPNGEGIFTSVLEKEEDYTYFGTFLNGRADGQMVLEWTSADGKKYHGNCRINNGFPEPVRDEKVLSYFPEKEDSIYYAFSDEKDANGIPSSGVYIRSDACIRVFGACK